MPQLLEPYFMDFFFFFLNSLPKDKILDWTKIKGFLEIKLNVTDLIMIFVFDREESIPFFSHNVLKIIFYSEELKPELCDKRLTHYQMIKF